MTKIIGHRGCSAAPGNTLESFRTALELGADGIELDVQLSRDGQVVVIHDTHLEDMTDGHGMVFDHDYAELAKLNASVVKPDYAQRTRIPLLAEVLELVAEFPDAEVNVELKPAEKIEPDYEERVLAVVADSGISERCYYSSFNHYCLRKIRTLNSQAQIFPLYMSGLIDPWEYIDRIDAHGAHPNFLSIVFADKLQPGLDAIAEFHARGQKVRPWTVNDERAMTFLIARGADAIITDEPAAGLTIRTSMQEATK